MFVEFKKMSGAGNDFVVIDNRDQAVKNGKKAARILCDRRWGIGADGLLLLEASTRASYKMMYYNADGSYGGMCGNGGRCIARFAYDAGVAPAHHTFEALRHIYTAEIYADGVSLKMKDPSETRLNMSIKKGDQTLPCHFVNTGAPHLVLFSNHLHPKKDVESVDVVTLGRWLRNHRRFKPNGTNINFVQKIGDNLLRIRTYERGVENETLACGTGAIAAAVVAFSLGFVRPPVRLLPQSKLELRVNFDHHNGLVHNVTLSGPVAEIFRGSISIDI